MTLVYIIIGGVGGGLLGWLFDRVNEKKPVEQPYDCSQPNM
jgi:hypothetical protein